MQIETRGEFLLFNFSVINQINEKLLVEHQ
jgi:hypothetical protein